MANINELIEEIREHAADTATYQMEDEHAIYFDGISGNEYKYNKDNNELEFKLAGCEDWHYLE